MVRISTFLYIRKFKEKISSNLYIANIVCKSWKVLKLEMKKQCYWKCWLRLSNKLNQQIKPHPTRWHYPIITYLILLYSADLNGYDLNRLMRMAWRRRIVDSCQMFPKNLWDKVLLVGITANPRLIMIQLETKVYKLKIDVFKKSAANSRKKYNFWHHCIEMQLKLFSILSNLQKREQSYWPPSHIKDQIISEQICGVLKISKKATKYCQDFCPCL